MLVWKFYQWIGNRPEEVRNVYTHTANMYNVITSFSHSTSIRNIQKSVVKITAEMYRGMEHNETSCNLQQKHLQCHERNEQFKSASMCFHIHQPSLKKKSSKNVILCTLLSLKKYFAFILCSLEVS